MKNSRTASATAMTTAKNIMTSSALLPSFPATNFSNLLGSNSSVPSSLILAASISTPTPVKSISTKLMTPRTTGSRANQLFFCSTSQVFTAIPPSCLRTASAAFLGERIITPPRTPWPPTVLLFACLFIKILRLSPSKTLETAYKKTERSPLCIFRKLFETVFLFETIHTSAGIDQLLLACKERMALGANVHFHLFFNRTCYEGFPASTFHNTLSVIRMYIRFHRTHPFSIKSQLLVYHKPAILQAFFKFFRKKPGRASPCG